MGCLLPIFDGMNDKKGVVIRMEKCCIGPTLVKRSDPTISE